MSFDLILSSVDREEMEGTISVLKIIALLIFMIYLKRSSVKMLKNYFHLDVCISIIYIYPLLPKANTFKLLVFLCESRLL